MNLLRVGIAGITGRMGSEISAGLALDPEFTVVFGASRQATSTMLNGIATPIFPSVRDALQSQSVDVLLDLSHRSLAVQNAEEAVAAGVPFVSGVTGLTAADLQALTNACESSQLGGLLVPNFAIGAVLMMHFSELAAKWLPHAEIIELHHDRKEDAPSGTALQTAQHIAIGRQGVTPEKRESFLKIPGARGGESHGVNIHSVRLPGLLAHQEVIFGSTGESLTLRHDSLARTSFLSGVKLACREVRSRSGLTVGLDAIMFGSP